MRKLFTLTLCIGLMLWSNLLSAQRYSLVFDENKGQWDNRALFKSSFQGGSLFLQADGLRYLFVNEEAIADYLHHPPKPDLPFPVTVESHVIAVDFEGANRKAQVKGSLEYGHYSNYFLGKDPSRWATGVKSYGMVSYEELYPGIDLEFIGNGNSLKYQYRLKPGADPDAIQLRFRGQEAMVVNDGELVIKTSFHEFREAKPYAYQVINGEQQAVDAAFVIEGDLVRYKLGAYRKDLPLVIDPVLIFCTYSGSTADNFGFTATFDEAGNFYSGGNVTDETLFSGGRYPATPGAFQTVYQGGGANPGAPINSHFPCDVAISKYDSSGSTLLWATYLGGDKNDYPHSMVVTDNEELIVFGTTLSDNFPTSSTAYDNSFNGLVDIFITKFADDGKSVIGSTYIGGSAYDGFIDEGTPVNGRIVDRLVFNYADNYRGDININPITGSVFVATATSSTDFPVTPNAFQTSKAGMIDGVVFEFDSNFSNLVWSSFLGGSKDDALYSVKFNTQGDIYVAGGSASTDLPSTSDAYRANFHGGRSDGILARINLSNKNLNYLSYFGTPAYDQIYFCDLDKKNRFYIYGQTQGTLQRSFGSYGQNKGGMFVSIFEPSLQTIEYQTTFGTVDNEPNLSPTAFVVDKCEKVYMAGWASNFPPYHSSSTDGLPVSPDAIKSVTDGQDFYLIVLDKNLNSLVYSTYFGGAQSADHVDGGTSRFNKEGIVYHSICGSCPTNSTPISDIATTPNAAFPVNTSPRCSNTSFKIDFQLKSAVESIFSPKPSLVGCSNDSIFMNNLSRNGEYFIWNFGDGSPEDTSFNPTHQFQDSGVYTIRLIAIDSNTCNISDTSFKTIRIYRDGLAGFDFVQNPCSYEVNFKNRSESVFSYFWDFGNGDSSFNREPTVIFEPGNYVVRLIINHQTICADTLDKMLSVATILRDSIGIPNVFTPDKNGINDCFTFTGLFECDEVKVAIFDRHSITVYESDEIPFCWDGTDKDTGKPLSAGVYYIVADIKLNGRPPFTYKGTVTLLR